MRILDGVWSHRIFGHREWNLVRMGASTVSRTGGELASVDLMPRSTDKLRILFLTQEYPPETGWGGIATYVQITARALALRGHEIHVLSTVEGQDERHYRDREVYVHRYGQRRLWPPLDERIRYRMPMTRQRLQAALSNYLACRRLGLKFDVVEAPEWMAEGLFFLFARKCPLVTHLHGSLADIRPVTSGPWIGTCVRRFSWKTRVFGGRITSQWQPRGRRLRATTCGGPLSARASRSCRIRCLPVDIKVLP